MHEHLLDPEKMALTIFARDSDNPRGSIGWLGECPCGHRMNLIQFNEETMTVAGWRLVKDA